MYFFSTKALIPAITLIRIASARITSAPNHDDTQTLAYSAGHRPRDAPLAWARGEPEAQNILTIITVVIKEPVTTICITPTTGSESGVVQTYTTHTGGPAPSVSPMPMETEYTTSTILSTVTYTVTSCEETVTKCPIGLVTQTVYTYTTVCPLSDTGSSTISSALFTNSSTVAISSRAEAFGTASVTLSSSGNVIATSSVSSAPESAITPGSSGLSAPASFSIPSNSATTSTSLVEPSSIENKSTASSSDLDPTTLAETSSSSPSETLHLSSPATTNFTATLEPTSLSSTISLETSTSSLSNQNDTISSSPGSLYTSATRTYVTPSNTSSLASQVSPTSSASSDPWSSLSTDFTSSSTILTSSSQSFTVSSTSSGLTTSSSSSSSSIASTSSSTKIADKSSSISSSASPTPTLPACYYWMEEFKHQGIAPFAAAPGSYQVFRNVKDFGAKGDGVTDDTAAINLAISTGDRCAPGVCNSTSTTPAVVYFPAGTYLVSSPIIDYYYTQMIGNPNCLPTIKASSSFLPGARWVIDANVYQPGGALGYGATNVFWRQMRNFIIDMTLLPSTREIAGLHWPTAQATSLQNIEFKMAVAESTTVGQEGLFVESGSGGFMTDLVFSGGFHGAVFSNQQFTMRNLTFYDATVAISMAFDWGWTYKGLKIFNCGIGIDMSSINKDTGILSVGSVTLIDSVFTNTPIGILTARSASSLPPLANSLIIENVQFTNVPTIVGGAGNSVLLATAAGSLTVAAWGLGNSYSGTSGPAMFSGAFAPNSRSGLTAGADFYERSKPQYENFPTSEFVSVRDAGAKGDGVTDDSDVLNAIIAAVAAVGKIIYFDAGDYLVTKTIYIPAGSRITGETYPVILSSGAYFGDIDNPMPVVQVGQAGETGNIEWSDMIVSTKGAQAGAILIEYNLASLSSTPAGLWDVHTRIGGFAGSDLSLANCPKTPEINITADNVPAQCIAASMSMHITASATGLYMENVWLWVADHDVEDAKVTQITIYAGRGLLIESTHGYIWMYGTSSEHHTLYQYQLSNTANIFMGQIQTETAYYQPNPISPIPFPTVEAYSDPVFQAGASGWGLRIVDSTNVLVYGAGLYSFFGNYDVHCSDQGKGETCQSRIFSVENSEVSVYNLNTVGTGVMVTRDGVDVAFYGDNLNGFVDTVALYRS